MKFLFLFLFLAACIKPFDFCNEGCYENISDRHLNQNLDEYEANCSLDTQKNLWGASKDRVNDYLSNQSLRLDDLGIKNFQVKAVDSARVVFDRRIKAEGLYGKDKNGNAYGVWLDGPLRPWKDGDDKVFFNIPHSENFRVHVPDWKNSSSWEVQRSPIFDSRRTIVSENGWYYHQGNHCDTHRMTEADYGNRFWLMGFWSEGSRVAAVAHHEWYRECKNGYLIPFNRKWVNAIHHLVSNDGGSSFLPKKYQPYANTGRSNSDRLVLVPEPYSVQTSTAHYGFFHPSNIVQEGNYYYATADYRAYEKMSINPDILDSGFIMMRTQNVFSSTGWEIYTSDGWKDTVGYQGNCGQKPYVFFRSKWNPYNEHHKTSMMAQSVHFHHELGLWMAFGVKGDFGNSVLLSRSLANPEWEKFGPIHIAGLEGGKAIAPYLSVVDPKSPGRNFMGISNNFSVYGVRDYGIYYEIPLQIQWDGVGVQNRPGESEVQNRPGESEVQNRPGESEVQNRPGEPEAQESFRVSHFTRGPFFVGQEPNIYFGTYESYCLIPSMDFFSRLTGSMSVDYLPRLNSIPSHLFFDGYCQFPIGAFFVGAHDIYYSYSNKHYCYVTSMQQYETLTGNSSVERIPRLTSLPQNLNFEENCKIVGN